MTRGIRDEDNQDEGFVVSSEAVVVRETDASITVDLGRHDLPGDAALLNEVTVPKSQIHADSEVHSLKDASRGELRVTTWLARERGWVDGHERSAPKRAGTWFGVAAPKNTKG
jgi:hypothetical protein